MTSCSVMWWVRYEREEDDDARDDPQRALGSLIHRRRLPEEAPGGRT